MSAAKPTLFFVPGAWHHLASFSGFTDRLRAAGYVVEGASLLSAAGQGGVGVKDDAALIAREMTKISDEGRSIVPIFHSYAGIPASEALPGLSVTERRAQNKSGGVQGIIYVAAFVPRQGQSLKDLSGGPLWDLLVVDEQNHTLTLAADPKMIFYNACPESEAERLAAALKPQSEQSFLDPCSNAGYAAEFYNGRRAYFPCAQDTGVEVHKSILAASGVEWNVKTLNADHTPFVSDPEGLIQAIGEAIRDFKPVDA